MKTLTDFKKFLALPGAKVRLVKRYDNLTINPILGEWRTVAKLQTNAVAFVTNTKSGKSWLYFPPASKFEFVDGLANVDGLLYELGRD